jgi:vacuolar fusion protein MON1
MGGHRYSGMLIRPLALKLVCSNCYPVQKLEKEGALDALIQAVHHESDYSVSELGIPGLRHFVYKSRAHVQVTVPEYEDPYDDLQERRRLRLSYTR